ncbi:MAG: uroporphyrinogen decarboxylase family protein [Spirochaetales bacterium]|nr:uroporphyrinogen decarboxylase family protein [Spirochaetales bacterium]
MTGKEKIIAVLNKEKIDSIPWLPFAGVHAGKLKGYTAKEVSTDAGKLIDSLREVNKLYKPDGQPIMFDLQIEAEILGCELLWSEDAPPTVASHPLSDVSDIPTHIPAVDEGRIPLSVEAMKAMKAEIGEHTALYGLITGPFTLASHLRGTNIFMDMIMNPEYVTSLLEYTTRVANAVAGYYIEAGMDVIAVVDPLVSQISPAHFAEFMDKPFSKVFDYIRTNGAFSSFFVCGNATANIAPMCMTKPDSISVDENVNLAEAKKVTDSFDIVIGGNIPLTSIMLFGTQQDNMKNTIDLIDSLDNTDRLIIAPGCDMPYDIPIENTIGVQQAVHQTDQIRAMVENYECTEIVFEGELPDYANLERPLIEVFTLDSITCAACTYMKASAMDIKKHFGDKVDMVEYKYTEPQNIARCKVMEVKQLPSIYINGELKYSSIIPNRAGFVSEVEKCL